MEKRKIIFWGLTYRTLLKMGWGKNSVENNTHKKSSTKSKHKKYVSKICTIKSYCYITLLKTHYTQNTLKSFKSVLYQTSTRYLNSTNSNYHIKPFLKSTNYYLLYY